MAGLAGAIVEKGYRAATIADVARHARVSKRTFYEHFADKGDCFVALALLSTDRVLAELREIVEGDLPWEERLETATRTYYERVGAEPALARTYFVEAQGTDPHAVRLRHEGLRRYANLLQDLSAQVAREEPEFHPIGETMATAVLGAMNELVLRATDSDEPDDPAQLAKVAAHLIRAVATVPEE